MRGALFHSSQVQAEVLPAEVFITMFSQKLEELIIACAGNQHMNLSSCGWLRKLGEKYNANEVKRVLTLITFFCLLIPKYAPADAFSITQWSEFRYPILYFISATVKQIGLGYMVPVSQFEKFFTIGIMLWGLYFYGWRFNGILSAIVMSRKDEELQRQDNLSIVKTFCEVEELPSEEYDDMKLSAALMWSSNDIFKNTATLKKFQQSNINVLMSETVQKVVSKKLRLFAEIPKDIQVVLSYQFSGT